VRVKKFTAATVKEAMRRVKEELGEDAIIVHTREHKKPILGLFGRSYVEVTAGTDIRPRQQSAVSRPADDVDPLLSSSPRQERVADRVELSSASRRNGIGTSNQETTAGQSSPLASPQLKALAESVLAKQGKTVPQQSEEEVRQDARDASDSLDRRLASLEKQMTRLTCLIEDATGGRPLTISPEGSAIDTSDPWRAHLKAQEIEESIIEEICSDLPSPIPRAALREALVPRLLVSNEIVVQNDEPGPKVVMLVGPTGVGKTTTLAKIAPGFTHLYQGGPKKVVFMTADLFRIAAVEQLQKYSEILRVPLEVVYTPEEASAVIERHQDADLILIDTGGTGQRNETQLSNLAAIAQACKPLEVHLVLSSTTKTSDLNDIIQRFGELEPQRLLFTKLDESTTFGNILNVVSRSGLPVSYLTTGQMVPEDIEIATSERLADLLLESREENEFIPQNLAAEAERIRSSEHQAAEHAGTAGGKDHA